MKKFFMIIATVSLIALSFSSKPEKKTYLFDVEKQMLDSGTPLSQVRAWVIEHWEDLQDEAKNAWPIPPCYVLCMMGFNDCIKHMGREIDYLKCYEDWQGCNSGCPH